MHCSILAPADCPVICHCLQVTTDEVRTAIAAGTVQSLRCVMQCTGAGTGCTACHRQIAELLREGRDQPSPSPICVER